MAMTVLYYLAMLDVYQRYLTDGGDSGVLPSDVGWLPEINDGDSGVLPSDAGCLAEIPN